MVVARHDQHAAAGRGAVGVAVLQGVAGAVDAGALAVPHGEDAVDFGAGVGLDLLRAEDGGGGEVLVDGGEELDAGLGEAVLAAPELEVERAERRAAVAGDEAAGVEAGLAVAARLVEEDAGEGLGAGQEDPAGGQVVAVGEAIVAEVKLGHGHRGRSWRRGQSPPAGRRCKAALRQREARRAFAWRSFGKVWLRGQDLAFVELAGTCSADLNTESSNPAGEGARRGRETGTVASRR